MAGGFGDKEGPKMNGMKDRGRFEEPGGAGEQDGGAGERETREDHILRYAEAYLLYDGYDVAAKQLEA